MLLEERFKKALLGLPEFKTKHLVLDQAIVEIGHPDELSSEQKTKIIEALAVFVPWKKGPFNIFGTLIDAEWRSDQKWDRLAPELGNLHDQKIADIGCNNGYYMFRMAAQKPRHVVGFEPYKKHYYNYQLLQRFAQIDSLEFTLQGVAELPRYPSYFDKVLCLGILYHHPNPIQILQDIHQSLVTGGEVFIDCQGIAGEDPVCLMPRGRYAKARGVWFLPTLSALENWLHRASFRNITCFYQGPLLSAEQRRTAWAPIDSLAEFLDPQDATKTIEGYPAPWRFYLKAVK